MLASGGMVSCASFPKLLKLGSCLLESGHHYLAASRAFVGGICDLARLGPPEPMMAVCDTSEPGLWLLGVGDWDRGDCGRGGLT